MAKKNASKDGVVYDTHSKVVMSQGGTFEKMKEKITAVRAVVPNKSNNEIALVLQHFENSVDCAVQAFVEGSAVEILKEWSVSGKKKPKKKKKPKAQSKPDPAPDGASVIAVEVPVRGASESVNGFLHANGSAAVDGDSVDSLSEPLESASLEEQEETHAEDTAAQARPRSVCGSQSGEDPGRSVDARRGAPSVDRSLKDLQRCAASLSRYRALIREESNSTVRRIKQSFAELQTSLIDREVTLLADMDKAKAEALSLLDWRQNRAEELKRLADQSEKLSEDQLTQLRADIKHFVSERKFDEELGRAGKFTDELEPLKNSITLFGSVHHPQVNFSSGSRCSSSASSSSIAAPVSAREEPPPQNRVPHKQIFHGNRRIIQGYQGNQRYNGTAQGSRGGFRQMGDRSHTHSSSHTHPSGPRGERGMQNTTTGLPQRPPRTHAH